MKTLEQKLKESNAKRQKKIEARTAQVLAKDEDPCASRGLDASRRETKGPPVEPIYDLNPD